MIFVTIGSMFPFERMIRAMDAWAATEGRGEERQQGREQEISHRTASLR